MHTQCPLHISKVSLKYLKEFLELLPASDFNNQGRKLQNGVRKSFLNVNSMSSTYWCSIMKISKHVLKIWFPQNFYNSGDKRNNSWTKSVRVVFLVPDIPTKCTQQPDSLFVLRFYGPVNPMGSCRAWSVYLTTRLLGRLSPLSG